MDFESRSVSARVTKYCVTFFLVKHIIKCIIQDYFSLIKLFRRDGEMLLYTYYIPCMGDSRNIIPRNVIINRGAGLPKIRDLMFYLV